MRSAAHRPAVVPAAGDLIAIIREEQESFDRVLATVLFTDIVDSTATEGHDGRHALEGADRRTRPDRPREVCVSSMLKDLTPSSGLAFDDRGECELKGVPDR